MEIFAASCLFPISAPPIPGGALAIEGQRIISVGPLARLRKEFSAPVTDFHGCILMPGLVNAHTHLELTHFPAWKIRKGLDYAPRTYVDWIIQVIKIKRGLSLNELELSLREGLRISLESGTTTAGDICSDYRLLPLYRSSRFSGRLFFELLGHDPQHISQQMSRLTEVLGNYSSDSIFPGLSPHAPHTLSPSFFRRIVQLAESRSLPLTVHVAESREEESFLHDTSGSIADTLYPFVGWRDYLPPARRISPVAFLDELGVLREGTSAVHCVHVNGADTEILKKRGVTVVLCPRSNDRLVVGKAPVQLFKKAGIVLGLGTDSLASNDSLSLWDEMRFLRGQFPGMFNPAEVLQMATLNSAGALQLSDNVGSLEPGKRGDFLVVKCPSGVAGEEMTEALIEEGQVVETFLGGGTRNGQ